MLSSKEIIEILKAGNPVSIIRCGDGEGIVMNAKEGYGEFELASNHVIKRQVGYSPSLEDVNNIRENLIEAYNNCDVIGIPNHKHETSAHWTKVLGILNKNCPKNKQVHCDIDIAYQWLDSGGFNELLTDLPVLNYIGCRNISNGFRSKFNIEIVNDYLVAPESKYTSGYDGEVHYPTQFNKAQRWMNVMLQRHPGTMLLVGAGVIGKIYCNWWRDRGGVAMDVGGVMDLWAGKVTRGPERGIDKVDLTYKL